MFKTNYWTSSQVRYINLITFAAIYTTNISIFTANDKFAFASYYGDHMVLQRGPQQAILWGYGPSPGSNVTVLLSGKPQSQ